MLVPRNSQGRWGGFRALWAGYLGRAPRGGQRRNAVDGARRDAARHPGNSDAVACGARVSNRLSRSGAAGCCC